MEFNQNLNPLDFYVYLIKYFFLYFIFLTRLYLKKALQKLKIIETYSGLDFDTLQGYLKKITSQSGSIVVLKDLKEHIFKFAKDDIICDEKSKNWLVSLFFFRIFHSALKIEIFIFYNSKLFPKFFSLKLMYIIIIVFFFKKS
jgi:hypothetical protein